MNSLKSIAIIVILSAGNPSFAQISNESQGEVITERQVMQALRLLIRAQVLGVKNSELIIKNPSIFDQLERQGRVESGGNQVSAICAKE